MSKRSTYLFGVFLTIAAGTVLCWYLCCKKQCRTIGKEQQEILENKKT